MPAGAGNDAAARRGRVNEARRRQRGFGDALFNSAAILIEPVKLGGNLCGFGGIMGGEQPHSQIGLAHAPAGIHARAERKAQIA